MPASKVKTIDPLSTVPFSAQLVALIKEDCRKGRWGVGEKMLSETQFTTEYGFTISRVTTRKALVILEGEGWTRGIGGRGWFCTRNK